MTVEFTSLYHGSQIRKQFGLYRCVICHSGGVNQQPTTNMTLATVTIQEVLTCLCNIHNIIPGNFGRTVKHNIMTRRKVEYYD